MLLSLAVSILTWRETARGHEIYQSWWDLLRKVNEGCWLPRRRVRSYYLCGQSFRCPCCLQSSCPRSRSWPRPRPCPCQLWPTSTEILVMMVQVNTKKLLIKTIFGDNNYCYTEAWQRFSRRSSSSCPNQNPTTRVWDPSLLLAVWLHQPQREQTYLPFVKPLNRIDLFQTGLKMLTPAGQFLRATTPVLL